jgi:hypothetical protein
VARTLEVRALRHEPSAVARWLHAGLLLFALGPVVALGVQILLVMTYLIGLGTRRSSETLESVAQVLSIGAIAGTLIGAYLIVRPPSVSAGARRATIAGVAMMAGAIALLVLAASAPGMSGATVEDVGSWAVVGGICLAVLGTARAARNWAPASNSASGVRIARRYGWFARAFVVVLLTMAIASNVLLRLGEGLFTFGQRGGIDWFFVFAVINGGLTLSLVAWVIVSAVVHVRLARRVDRERAIARSLVVVPSPGR